MSSNHNKATLAIYRLNAEHNLAETMQAMKDKKPYSLHREKLPSEGRCTNEGTENRLRFLENQGKKFEYLTGKKQVTDIESLQGNIENYIGMSMVPTGVIGPLHVVGNAARGDFYVPLATSEGALVASYDRGARAAHMAGGISSICFLEGVQRSPVFRFENLVELGVFLMWVLQHFEKFQEITSQSSRYAKLLEMGANIEGNQLILTFEYNTGDASGQNMVTLCTDEICNYIIANTPQKPMYWFLEGNYSGDKKATALSFTNVRGKKVTAEVVIPEDIVIKVLNSTPKAMENYWKVSTVGVLQSGAIGAQGHVANGLCALFIATGQDAACVAEAAVGITRMEVNGDGSLYACVTLPNIIVGTVGGGTRLPSQQECLELMDCYGAGKARKFAEICGALALAGELSIVAALTAGDFSSAHKKFGRKKV